MRVSLQQIRPFIQERQDHPELDWPVIHVDPSVLPDWEVPNDE